MAKIRRLKRVKKRKLTFFRVLFLTIIIGISMFYFLQSSFWFLESVAVKGNEYIEQAEIIQLANLPNDLNIFKLDLKQAEERVLLHPLVKEVNLNRKLPREIVIQITERSPVIILPLDGGFYEMDEQGVLIRRITTVSNAKLPLVTGLDLADSEIGSQIPQDWIEDALAIIDGLPKTILNEISEVNLAHKNAIHLHINDISINFGEAERIEKKAKTLMDILATTELQAEKLKYIDLSFIGPPVVKYRE